MHDPVPAIQYVCLYCMMSCFCQSSIGAMGSLIGYSTKCAQRVISDGHISLIVNNLYSESKNHRKAALFALKNLAKVSCTSSDAITADKRIIPGILAAIRDTDVSVRESGVWTLSYIVKRCPELAELAIESGCLPLIQSALENKQDLPLLRISISLLGDIARHNESLSEHILQLDIVGILLEHTGHIDVGMRKQSTACLSQLVKHTADQAARIMSYPQFLHTMSTLLKDINITVRRNACIIVRELCERDASLATSVVDFGFVPLLGSYMQDTAVEEKLPAIMCLGYIASHSDTMAKGLIVSNIIPTICNDLIEAKSDIVRCKLVWLLEQIGKHSADNCKSLNEHGALTRILALYMHANTSQDLRDSSKQAFGVLIQNTTDCDVLDRLLAEVPMELRGFILDQLARELPNNMHAKKKFVQSGSLQRILSIKGTDDDLSDSIAQIRNCFPPEILEFFEPSEISRSSM